MATYDADLGFVEGVVVSITSMTLDVCERRVTTVPLVEIFAWRIRRGRLGAIVRSATAKERGLFSVLAVTSVF